MELFNQNIGSHFLFNFLFTLDAEFFPQLHHKDGELDKQPYVITLLILPIVVDINFVETKAGKRNNLGYFILTYFTFTVLIFNFIIFGQEHFLMPSIELKQLLTDYIDFYICRKVPVLTKRLC